MMTNRIRKYKKKNGDAIRIIYNQDTNFARIEVMFHEEPEEKFQFVCGGGYRDMMGIYCNNVLTDVGA